MSITKIIFRIAIIQFPGTNCESESFRAIKKAGMRPEFFRWNADQEELKKFDGYFIPGGFSYEDRVRSGAIAGRDPIMEIIKEEAGKGKPVIGICNGAQILIESGLIPGLSSHHLGAALGWNNHGYLNIWVNIKNDVEAGRSAFNNYESGHFFRLPIAHGEGRFVVPDEILNQLKANGQTVFRYCDNNGQIKEDFPVNPNGAVYNLAGVCNPAGNVLALMPHPERVEAGGVIFESMRKYLEKYPNSNAQFPSNIQIPMPKSVPSEAPLQWDKAEGFQIENYQKSENNLEILVDLIITDNEAETLQIALNNLGFNEARVKRFTHWEIGLAESTDQLIDELIKSNELLNTNKEIPYINNRSKLKPDSHKLLVRYQNDFTGEAKLDTLVNRLELSQLKSVKKGVLWEIDCGDETWRKILDSNILFNPYSQTAQIYGQNSH